MGGRASAWWRGKPREQTGRGEGYYVYGLSWGSMLAQEFAVTRPSGSRGLILSGALADGELYIRTQWRDRISTVPTFSRQPLRELEDGVGGTRQPHTGSLMVRSVRISPRAKYSSSRGRRPSERTTRSTRPCRASLSSRLAACSRWRIVERNAAIDVPTLVLAGEFDTMSIECHQQVVDSIPTAWPLVVIPRAAHVKEVDEPRRRRRGRQVCAHVREDARSTRRRGCAEAGRKGKPQSACKRTYIRRRSAWRLSELWRGASRRRSTAAAHESVCPTQTTGKKV